MTHHDLYAESSVSTEQAIHRMREHLPEYATMAALGKDPAVAYPEVAAHVAICPACRAELDELLELTVSTYKGEIEAAPQYPQPNLSFLDPPAPAPDTQGPVWR